MATSTRGSPFLDVLPAEIRLQIYEDLLRSQSPLWTDHAITAIHKNHGILFANKQTFREVRDLGVVLQAVSPA